MTIKLDDTLLPPGSHTKEACAKLESFARHLRSYPVPFSDKQTRLFVRLRKFDLSFKPDTKMNRPSQVDPQIVERVLSNLEGLKALDLSGRQLYYLCWSECAYEPKFLRFLRVHSEVLPARWLVGLVSMYHEKWSTMKNRNRVEAFLKLWISKFSGKNARVDAYNKYRRELFGDRAAEKLGVYIWESSESMDDICEQVRISPQSELLKAALLQAIQMEIGVEFKERGIDFVLGLAKWQYTPAGTLKLAAGRMILFSGLKPDAQEKIRDFVLKTPLLGDPRRPANHKNWIGMGKAQEQFVQWLCREDIEWFFDVVIPNRSDPHGRKAFWLGFVPQLKSSRVILSWDDYNRLSLSGKSETREGRDYARFRGQGQIPTSAFILEFRDLIAVEFSKVNNACYLYKPERFSKVVPQMWTTFFDSPDSLKNPKLTIAEDRFIHIGDWQVKLRNKLAQFGIRPR